jgi:hypothetical protein
MAEHISTDEVVEIIAGIFSELVLALDVPVAEALGRTNDWIRRWSFDDPASYTLLGHEEPAYWARDVLYGKDSRWWLIPAEDCHARPWPREPS